MISKTRFGLVALVCSMFATPLFAQSDPQVLWDCETDLTQYATPYPDARLAIWLNGNGTPHADFYLGTLVEDPPNGSSSTGLAFSSSFTVSGDLQDLKGGQQGSFTGTAIYYPMGASQESIKTENVGLEFTGPDGKNLGATLTVGNTPYKLSCVAPPPLPLTVDQCAPPPAISIGPKTSNSNAPAPYATGACDPTPFSQNGYSAKRGQVDTSNLQTALDAAVAGDTVTLLSGTYCLTQPLKVPDGVTVNGQGMGKTIVEVPKAVVWSAWCATANQQACVACFQNQGSCGCCSPQVKYCPASPDPSFDDHYAFEGGQFVTISNLTYNGNSDTFYPTSGTYQYPGEPSQPTTVGGNCHASSSHAGSCDGNVLWVNGVAGGIHMGPYWTADHVTINSSVLWGITSFSGGDTITNSVSDGPTCEDGIGEAGGGFPSNMVKSDWTPKSGRLTNFLLGAGASPTTCPGAHIDSHHWLKTFHSYSTIADFMNTTGGSVVNSLNDSNNQLIFEGVWGSTIAHNVFNGKGDMNLHSNEAYAHNDYGQKSGGNQLKAVSMLRDIHVFDNTLHGGRITVKFDDPLIATPCNPSKPGQGTCRNTAKTPLPTVPFKGGHIVVGGATAAEANHVYDSALSGILWEETHTLSAGGSKIENNIVENPVQCPTCSVQDYPAPPGQPNGAGYNNSGITVYKDTLSVQTSGNTLGKASGDMACGIQGYYLDLSSVEQNNTFTGSFTQACMLPKE